MTTKTRPTTSSDAADRPPHVQLDPAPVLEQFAHERITDLAYGIYLARGAQDGHALDDWLEAEQRFVDESLAP